MLLEHLTEVPFAENNDVVEALAPDAAEKPPANGIRRLDQRPKNADAGTGRGAVEVSAELAVLGLVVSSRSESGDVATNHLSGGAVW
jgi:hypothetical protein